MLKRQRRIIVIAKQKEFDAAAWRRLLIAYAYALYDKRRAQEEQAKKGAERREGAA